MSRDPETSRIETLAVHAGERRPGPEGSVVYPIFQGTVFGYAPGTSYNDLKYIRLSTNPTQVYLHDKLAALEGAEAALATASGMAALTTILMSFMKQGDHLLAGEAAYGGTHAFITQHAADLGWTYDFIDSQRPETWEAVVKPTTRLVLVETIGNPLMRVPRLTEVAAFARAHSLLSIIDNTFATPVNFRPLAHGYDLVFHSATKYLNGHSDIVAGCILGREELMARVRPTLSHLGGTLDPHAAYLMARGLKTLAIRVKAHNENAMLLARFLAGHQAVLEVNYPGLKEHPDHEHASELLGGFGGMLSVRPKGGVEAAERLLGRLRIPAVAPSLGGVESLVTRPATTSHAGLSAAERARMGIADDLVRISCGIESADDLIADFSQALG